jgi:hypothetical protein
LGMVSYRFLTVAILVLHVGWLGYVVFGGFLAWRWPRALWPHVGAVAWGVALIAAGLECPLTKAEDWSRQNAGEPALTAGFIDRYVEGVIYPEGYTGLVQVLVAVVVTISWAGTYEILRRRTERTPSH